MLVSVCGCVVCCFVFCDCWLLDIVVVSGVVWFVLFFRWCFGVFDGLCLDGWFASVV